MTDQFTEENADLIEAIQGITNDMMGFVTDQNLISRHVNPLTVVAGMVNCAADTMVAILTRGTNPPATPEEVAICMERFAATFIARAATGIRAHHTPQTETEGEPAQ